MDIHGKGTWERCFAVPDVNLPRGMYLGFSAATGDLADNHDIISVSFAPAPPLTEAEAAELRQLETRQVCCAESACVHSLCCLPSKDKTRGTPGWAWEDSRSLIRRNRKQLCEPLAHN